MLATRLLRQATSAAAGGDGTINIQQATTRLGSRNVRTLILDASAQQLFRSRDQRIASTARQLWEHSLAVALLSRDLAAIQGGLDAEAAYLAGLVHDVGKPIAAAILLEVERASDKSRFTLTADTWLAVVQGVHRTIGVALAEKWRLPEAVAQAIRDSSEYDSSNRQSLGNVVCFANSVAKLQGIYPGTFDKDDAEALLMVGRSLLGLDDEVIARLSTGSRDASRRGGVTASRTAGLKCSSTTTNDTGDAARRDRHRRRRGDAWRKRARWTRSSASSWSRATRTSTSSTATWSRSRRTRARRDRLASVFRTIHTIKGTCGFLGFGKLESVAHVGENLLSRLRDGRLTLNAEITSGLLAMVDAVRRMLASIEATGSDGEHDYAELIARLNAAAGGARGPAGRRAVAGRRPPAPRPTSRRRRGHRGADAELEQERRSQTPTRGRRRRARAARQAPAAARAGSRPRAERAAAEPSPPQAAAEARRARGSPSPTRRIRVDVGLLDKLMNLVGELVLARNQILQFTAHADGHRASSAPRSA